MSLSRTRALLAASLLMQAGWALPAVAQATPPHLRELAAKDLPYASESLAHVLEERMVLPVGYPEDLANQVVVHLDVTPTGQLENARIGLAEPRVSAGVATAILVAVRQLPVLVPGREAGQPVRASLTLRVRPGVAAAAANRAAEARTATEADSTEARTLRAGTIRLRPGETLGHLLHRVLPATCSESATQLVRYAWVPNPAGPQLFFDARGHGEQDEQYEAVLFVLDPVGAGAYDVQAINLGSMGDLTDVIAIFFADANHDGQKDLLAITQCDLREGPSKELPLGWRAAHYQTTALYYRGRTQAGRPRYENAYLPSLDELPTAAAVRHALAAPPRKKAPLRNPSAKAAK